ncbi:unnamed protein product [Darwinula stevensoni]|uniref:Uncharacterized protein n=1 Tax=Darwinula stevensoni TaxID=69355 RepID=A0A7R8X724_9CRUS|nr:unnamed protein product [Darwinula stevensoni]CAG0886507.1 unnamed protein product [Darwinula stevensoni]
MLAGPDLGARAQVSSALVPVGLGNILEDTQQNPTPNSLSAFFEDLLSLHRLVGVHFTSLIPNIPEWSYPVVGFVYLESPAHR